jgi:hypothetical protein
MLPSMKAALLTLVVMMAQPSAAFAAEEIPSPSTNAAPAKHRPSAAALHQNNIHGHAPVRRDAAATAERTKPAAKKAKIGPRPEMW